MGPKVGKFVSAQLETGSAHSRLAGPDLSGTCHTEIATGWSGGSVKLKLSSYSGDSADLRLIKSGIAPEFCSTVVCSVLQAG